MTRLPFQRKPEKKFFRECPKCKKQIGYMHERTKNTAEMKMTACRSCDSSFRNFNVKGEKNPFYGKKHSAESKVKMKTADKGYTKTSEFAASVSAITRGEKNPMHGRTLIDVWTERYGPEEAKRRETQRREKMAKTLSGSGNPMFGKPAPFHAGNGYQGWYKGHFFRSLRELSYIFELEDKGLNWMTGESQNFKIPYVNFDGHQRNYFPDFIVDGKRVVECKPKHLHATKSVLLKLAAALEFCRVNGFSYELIDPVLQIDRFMSLIETGDIRVTDRTRLRLYKV